MRLLQLQRCLWGCERRLRCGRLSIRRLAFGERVTHQDSDFKLSELPALDFPTHDKEKNPKPKSYSQPPSLLTPLTASLSQHWNIPRLQLLQTPTTTVPTATDAIADFPFLFRWDRQRRLLPTILWPSIRSFLELLREFSYSV